MHCPTLPTRRWILAATASAALVATGIGTGTAWASQVTVPVKLQAKLLAKVAKYDRNMAGRAAGTLRVLVVRKPGNAASGKTASQLSSVLKAFPNIAGIPHAVSFHDYADADALSSAVKSEKVSIVYLTPGLDSEVKSIAHALKGVSTMSVSAVAKHVQAGAVVGFDLVEGKPKLLANLGSARAQKVQLNPALLKLMDVVE